MLRDAEPTEKIDARFLAKYRGGRSTLADEPYFSNRSDEDDAEEESRTLWDDDTQEASA